MATKKSQTRALGWGCASLLGLLLGCAASGAWVHFHQQAEGIAEMEEMTRLMGMDEGELDPELQDLLEAERAEIPNYALYSYVSAGIVVLGLLLLVGGLGMAVVSYRA